MSDSKLLHACQQLPLGLLNLLATSGHGQASLDARGAGGVQLADEPTA